MGIGVWSELIEVGALELGAFDLVIFCNVLLQVAKFRQTLRHARDFLRPGGAVVIRSYNSAFHAGMRKTFNATRWTMSFVRAFDQTVFQTIFHLYASDVRTIAGLLGDMGFAGCKVAPT